MNDTVPTTEIPECICTDSNLPARPGCPYCYPDPGGQIVNPITALLPCGCPPGIVADEGHQEGCDERAKATEVASLAGDLRRLAAMIEATPELAEALRYSFQKITCYTWPDRAHADLAAAARAGLRHGATVDKEVSNASAGVVIKFGQVGIKVFTDRDAVCERVVTGTREVTEQVPDPDALAAVPIVEVTKTVEDVEWRCGSILKEVTR